MLISFDYLKKTQGQQCNLWGLVPNEHVGLFVPKAGGRDTKAAVI